MNNQKSSGLEGMTNVTTMDVPYTEYINVSTWYMIVCYLQCFNNVASLFTQTQEKAMRTGPCQ